MHEGKVHVTLHRLRKCLSRCCPDAKGMITVRDGVVLLDEAFDICAVGPSEGDETCVAGAVGLRERVVQCLTTAVELPPRELERRLGVSRSALNTALRGLIAVGTSSASARDARSVTTSRHVSSGVGQTKTRSRLCPQPQCRSLW